MNNTEITDSRPSEAVFQKSKRPVNHKAASTGAATAILSVRTKIETSNKSNPGSSFSTSKIRNNALSANKVERASGIVLRPSMVTGVVNMSTVEKATAQRLGTYLWHQKNTRSPRRKYEPTARRTPARVRPTTSDRMYSNWT